MFKYEQTDSTKSSKKPKEVKLLNNYIPVKKTNAYSNVSEYETETSIQKIFRLNANKIKIIYKLNQFKLLTIIRQVQINI